MLFREIEHQERAVSILLRALAGGRVHHAYLFEGPEGVGKETAARALTAGLLCLDPLRAPTDDPCGQCDSCRLLASDNHPDYRLIHRGLHKQHPDKSIRDSKGLFLVVDVIRHFLIEPASTRSTLGRRRVFLIRDAERMNEGAQNALLKTLEEPPGEACLILISSSGERLLPTIRSRCQRIPFDLLPKAFIAQKMLEQTEIEPSAAGALAALSEGRLGAALQWHRIGLLTTLAQTAQILANGLPSKPEAFGKALLEIADGLAIRTIEQVEHFADENDSRDETGGGKTKSSAKVETDDLRAALKLTFMLIAAVHRDAMAMRAASESQGAHGASSAPRILPDGTPAIMELARGATADELGESIRAVAVAERMLDRNVSPQLVCEHLAIGLSGEKATMQS